ncbi:hypothetical protein IW261DRAFT_1466542 [Armillaria novae-zelandiae]|uniref:Uncharacterized protein n=1 Tax=Armillaria novae-zelandiae TaxID=153914 RepID=A0AA39PHX9_9AGAR|nr:hypothetical protein IW261DRAFT_1466542 [Armillaria novae-zelandiae]
MSVRHHDMRYQLSPPYDHYFTFSIDVAATLELYCDGGDTAMLQKLEGVQDRQYAGYTFFDENPAEDEMPKFQAIGIRPVQQGLTKPHPWKLRHFRPHMCAPISPTTAHPRSREPLDLSRGPLPWDNCYHPTCYDIFARVPSEWRDYYYTPCVADFTDSFYKALEEDDRYIELLRAGLDDDRILRIIDGREDGPDTDYASETDSQICKTLLAKIPGSDKPEEDSGFVPILRIDHVLSNVSEISDPSQLHGDVDLFQEIVQEYQLARYGSILLHPPEGPEVDDASIPDDFSMAYSGASAESFSSLPETSSSSPDLHEPDSTSEESPQVAVPIRKGKWKLKSLVRRAFDNFVELMKWPRKVSNKL